MAEDKAPTDWAADVKRYVPDADDSIIAGIVRYCGIALRTRDASLVSFSDKVETDRVRTNFCKKKLALEDPDDVIDAAIAKVGERMSDTRTRHRVTVYYLLAEHFGKLGLFAPKAGKSAKGAKAAAPIAPLAAVGAAGAVAAAASEPAATAAVAEPKAAEPAAATPVAETPVAAAPVAAAATTVAAAAAAPVAAAPLAAAAPLPPGTRGVYTLRSTTPRQTGGGTGGAGSAGGAGDGFMGLAAAMFGGAAAIMIVAAIAGSYIGGRFDTDPPPPPAAPAAPVAVAEPAPPAIPDGAGIVSETVEGRPKVSVFFDVGKNDIAPGFDSAVAPIKAWLDANPADRAQLSGFTDPTGNAAANAELAKRRAQAVAAALTAQGVAEDRMDLVKPDDTSDEAADLAGARRVEITVTGG